MTREAVAVALWRTRLSMARTRFNESRCGIRLVRVAGESR